MLNPPIEAHLDFKHPPPHEDWWRDFSAFFYVNSGWTSAGGIGRRTTTWRPEDVGRVKRVPAKNGNWLAFAANKLVGRGPLRNLR